MAFELVYRVENRCKSSGAPVGAFPKPLRGRVGPESGPPLPKTNPTKKRLTALELLYTTALALDPAGRRPPDPRAPTPRPPGPAGRDRAGKISAGWPRVGQAQPS